MKKVARTFVWIDIIALLALPLMYSYNVIGPVFHEIGGAIVIALFVAHGCMSLFAGPKKGKTFSYIIDALMVAAFVAVAVSGLFISKLFVIGSAATHGVTEGISLWRVLHGPVSILALVFLGIHLGLKWSWFKTIVAKYIHLPEDIAKPVGTVIVVVLLVGGLGSFWATGAIGQLATPILMKTASKSGVVGGTQSGIGSILMGAGGGRGAGRDGGMPPGGAPGGMPPGGVPGGAPGTQSSSGKSGNTGTNSNSSTQQGAMQNGTTVDQQSGANDLNAAIPPSGFKGGARGERESQNPFIMWLMYSMMLSVPVLITRGVCVARTSKKIKGAGVPTNERIIAEMISAAEKEKLRLTGIADEPTA